MAELEAAQAAIEPYRAILAHAELELELAGRAEVQALAALGVRWQELIAGLPERPPAAAAGLLQRATLIHERTRVELARLREDLLGEIQRTSRARRTADGYAGQLRARPRLDRRA
jgi:hypothetical protein